MNLDFCNGCDGTGGCVPECVPTKNQLLIHELKLKIQFYNERIHELLQDAKNAMDADTAEGLKFAAKCMIRYRDELSAGLKEL